MPHCPHPVLWLSAVVALAFGLCPACADDVETIKEKLFQAKKAYDAETQKFRAAVDDLLNKREDDARNAGNKKLLDQVKAERAAFEKLGELPATVPPAVLKQIRTARADLDKAYIVAVKDYVRLKDDSGAAATEKEQQEFAFSSALLFGKRTYLVTLKHYDVKVWNNAFSNNGTNGEKRDMKLKVNGELIPHSIFVHPGTKDTAQVRYPLAGKWIAFHTTIGVPKIEENGNDPSSQLTFEILGDGKSLWKSEPVTKREAFQTCTVRVEKVKVLTLQVHCPDGFGWARSLWIEPVLIE